MTFVFLKEWDNIVTRVSRGWGSKVKEYVRREITLDLCKKSKGKLQL